MQIILSPVQKKALKGQAHHLDPVVLLGDAGLSPAVLKEIHHALDHHELIKVRLGGQDKAQRIAMAEEITSSTQSALVQLIGKLAVLWRPKPQAQPSATPRKPGTRQGFKKTLGAQADLPKVVSAPRARVRRSPAQATAYASAKAPKTPAAPRKTASANARSAAAPASPAPSTAQTRRARFLDETPQATPQSAADWATRRSTWDNRGDPDRFAKKRSASDSPRAGSKSGASTTARGAAKPTATRSGAARPSGAGRSAARPATSRSKKPAR
jgi:RNA-binding protein